MAEAILAAKRKRRLKKAENAARWKMQWVKTV
jgi:hypothetical protein